MKSIPAILLVLSIQVVITLGLMSNEEPIKKCTIPRIFEGKFKLSLKTGTPTHGVQMTTGRGTVHVDDTIGKAAVFQKVVDSGELTDINVYMSSNITYYDIPTTRMCIKKDMDIPIVPSKVIPGAPRHIKRGKVQGIVVQIWEFSRKNEMGFESARVYLKEDNCMFVKVEMSLVIRGQSTHVVEDFYNMRGSVKDASIFVHPKTCVKPSGYGNLHRLPRSVDLHVKHAIARYGTCGEPGVLGVLGVQLSCCPACRH